MKQVLGTKLGQQLTLTPQLQQAIRLLQLSAQELAQEIQKGLESNPLLELSEDATPPVEPLANNPDSDSNKTTPTDQEALTTEDAPTTTPQTENDATDTMWADNKPRQHKEDYESFVYEIKDKRSHSLKEHLIWQMQLTPFSENDKLITETIIDAIDEDGYLSAPLTELLGVLEQSGAETSVDEIEAVLHRVQQFDPVGVGSRDLREYLLIQLSQQPEDTPYLQQATMLAQKFLQEIAIHDYKAIRQQCQLSEKEIVGTIGLIKSLNPRPRYEIAESETEYIIPDVIVSKNNGKWVIELNNAVTPAIQVNRYYASILGQHKSSENYLQLKQQLQEARWLVKSVSSRNETLLKVSTCIINKQTAFLEYGDIAMKPLILQDIAEKTQLHESTVSRITNQKYIQTPIGVYELKYFFSSHLQKEDGQECSSIAIRALIKKIIASEPQDKPLSDNKIATLLATQQGIHIARRTITKYREAMKIPASNLRKRQNQFASE